MRTSLTLFAILGVMGANHPGAQPAAAAAKPPIDTAAAAAGLETATFALG
jgi:hypothetical protein